MAGKTMGRLAWSLLGVALLLGGPSRAATPADTPAATSGTAASPSSDPTSTELAPSPAPSVDAEESGAEESGAAHLQHIRDRYSAALALPREEVELSCEEDYMSVSLARRVADGDLVWLQYGIGDDHGSRSWEVLLQHGTVLFVLQETTSWSFDTASDVDPGSTTATHTVDTSAQLRFYFQDGTLLKALSKGAVARSVRNESIQQKVAAAVNEPLASPDLSAVWKQVRSMLEATRDGGDTELLCDF
jgi:hypothetical protein